MRPVAPPGWPREVRPPDAPDWEVTAASWLLDLCPAEYRRYPGLRRHVVVLARFAVLHVEAQQAASARGLSEIRADLKDVATLEAVEAAVQTFQLDDAPPVHPSRRRARRGRATRTSYVAALALSIPRMTAMDLTLAPVTADNWRDVADLAPHDEQRRFVAALGARYLLLGIYGKTWHNLGVFEGDTAVAHVMWGIDDDGSHWIGGLLVDAAHQGRGVGRATVERLLDQWRDDHRLVRASCRPDNAASRALFASLGFIETGEWDDAELVLERQL